MRIISGELGGRTVQAPTGTGTRPTSDRTREGLFSMLASRLGSFEGLRVADLFAGSGALGIEALSRGAAFCQFVEQDRAALDCLKHNIERLKVGPRSDVRAQPVEHGLAPAPPFDLIFLDPPYGTGLAQKAVDRIAGEQALARGGWVSAELHGESLKLPPEWELAAERRFGKAIIQLLRSQA